MSIIPKLNKRIHVKSIHTWGFTFLMDGKKDVDFFAEDTLLKKLIIDFCKNGYLIENIKNNDRANFVFDRFDEFVKTLEKNNLIDVFIEFKNKSVNLIAIPTCKPYELKTYSINKNSKFVFSRFSYLFFDKDKMILKSPLSGYDFFISLSLFNLFFRFISDGFSYNEILNFFSSDKPEIKLLIKLLIENNIVNIVDEIDSDHLKTWEFHDLLFHTQSRLGNSDDATKFGSTNRFEYNEENTDKKEAISCINLKSNNFKNSKDVNGSFYDLLEKRRSYRFFNENESLDIESVSEFLYISFGAREVVNEIKQSVVFKTYPGAGAIHELECYLVVNKCEGLQPGIYHYDSINHLLLLLNNDENYCTKILSQATTAMGSNANTPHLLVVITSRFQKIACKYERMSYRSTLISLGCALQTMSLVATSMEIGSCIVGSGNHKLFAEALGVSALEESCVGELAIGKI